MLLENKKETKEPVATRTHHL